MNRNPLMAVAVLAALLCAGLAQANVGPDDVIRQASDQVLDAVNARRDELKADPDELYRVVDDILLPRFDRRYTGGLVMGKYWRQASAEQRDRFILALYRSLVKTYASGILEYRGDQLQILPVAEEELTEGKVIVETRVTLDTGVVTPVNYRMRLTDEGWKAYDVIIEGISYVANYRKQYASEFRAKGIDGVIKELEAKAAKEPEAAATSTANTASQ
ncbi:MAG: ABC transporter substrate-binding protein [Gammaproteobacteria bacterium]